MILGFCICTAGKMALQSISMASDLQSFHAWEVLIWHITLYDSEIEEAFHGCAWHAVSL